MSDRKLADIRHAYELWVTGATVNDVPREPKPSWDFEFSTFLQGYYYGRMSVEADLSAVTAADHAAIYQSSARDYTAWWTRQEGIVMTASEAPAVEHAEWCHTVVGCIEPDHCTCDRQWATTQHERSNKRREEGK